MNKDSFEKQSEQDMHKKIFGHKLWACFYPRLQITNSLYMTSTSSSASRIRRSGKPQQIIV